MGIHLRFIWPGEIGEVSIIGFALLIASIAFGQYAHDNAALAAMFTFSGTQLTIFRVA